MELRICPHKIKKDCAMKNHTIHCLQLDERSINAKERKRKAACSVDLPPKEEYEERRVEEDNELNETLCILKSKLSMNPERKRKLLKVVSIKSEGTSSEMGCQSDIDTCLPYKVEDPEDCFNGLIKPAVTCDEEVQTVDMLNKFHNSADAFSGQMDDTTGDQVSDMAFTKSGATEIQDNTNEACVRSIDSAYTFQKCTLKEVSYDALYYVQPLVLHLPSIGENAEMMELDQTPTHLLLMPTTEDNNGESYNALESFSNARISQEDQSVDLLNKFHNDAFSGQLNDNTSVDQVPDMNFDTESGATEIEDKTKMNISDGSTMRTEINSISDPAVVLLCTDTEKGDLEIYKCGDSCEITPPRMEASCILEMSHPPKSLLLTRKVSSPASKEKLSMAFKGIESVEEIDQCSKVGSPGATNDEHECEFKGNNISISLRKINKSNKKGRRFRCTNSTQSCSQSVIKFSRHQMHVMNCLTKTVLLEMESMKKILEGSLHSESTNNVTSSLFDMNKVKTAIKRASKAKDSTQKRLSKMSKDCKRFCKIVETLHVEKVSSSGNEISKKESKKKVKFADEDGGVLSHVKIFERDEALQDEWKNSVLTLGVMETPTAMILP